MSRVEWTRLSGDEVEEVVAVLLSRRHPDCVRIRPSRGDGGIDLLLPQSDGSHHVVHVKKVH
ncbi:restriction endonuclease [Streptomyces sp. NPDC060027]|uniref:restriction endonuclease n=1 Tax=Streptomyces sp. NPDC060027 TaxID=3347040 RepID=UPI00369316E5